MSELFGAAVERADVRTIPSVDAHVRPQVKVQRKALSTSLERTLERERERGDGETSR